MLGGPQRERNSFQEPFQTHSSRKWAKFPIPLNQQPALFTPQLEGKLLSASIYNFHSGDRYILERSLPTEIISARLLFSGSLLYGEWHQLSSKKQFRSGGW